MYYAYNFTVGIRLDDVITTEFLKVSEFFYQKILNINGEGYQLDTELECDRILGNKLVIPSSLLYRNLEETQKEHKFL